MEKILCPCTDELTNHVYGKNKKGVDGYVCVSCLTFKSLDENGEFDVEKSYTQSKSRLELLDKFGAKNRNPFN